MEYIKEWLKSILYMKVLLMICESLVQKTKYERYFRLFSGFLMMMCLMKPLIDLTGAGQYLDASFFRNQFKNDWKLIEQSEDLKTLEADMKKSYSTAIEMQVKELGASFFIEVTNVTVRWNAQGDSVKEIEVKGEAMGEQEGIPQTSLFRETLMDYYGLESADIEMEVYE